MFAIVYGVVKDISHQQRRVRRLRRLAGAFGIEMAVRLRRLAGAFGIEMAVRNGQRNANANGRLRSWLLCQTCWTWPVSCCPRRRRMGRMNLAMCM